MSKAAACADQLVRQRVAVAVGGRHGSADGGPHRCVLSDGQLDSRRGEGGRVVRRGPEFRVVRTSAEVPGVTAVAVPVRVDAGIAGWRLESGGGLSGHAGCRCLAAVDRAVGVLIVRADPDRPARPLRVPVAIGEGRAGKHAGGRLGPTDQPAQLAPLPLTLPAA